jgi:hypothetical protein
MSGPLAVAGISAALRDLLQTGMTAMRIGDSLRGAASGDVAVSVGAPDLVVTEGTGAASQLNLFLYNTARNSGWANLGLPSRDHRGDNVSNPVLGLDLYYLLTAYGAKDFDAEVLLGGAMQVMHDTPGLDRDFIRSVLESGLNVPKNVQFCGLADQVEQILITPLPMSTEEIVRLWSAFQSNYRPSIAYVVSVVLLQSARSTRSALPVRGRNMYSMTFKQPRVDRVERADDPVSAITADATVRILGANLDAPNLQLLINGIDVSAGIISRGPSQLLFTLLLPHTPPPAQWPTGLYTGIASLQIVVPRQMGTPPVPHGAVESSVVPFVLAPTVTVSTLPGVAKIVCTTPVGKAQKVRLLLNETDVPPNRAPHAYSFDAPAGNGIADPPGYAYEIDFKLANVAPGNYLVRVRIDGAESPLGVDAGGVYATPKVTL